MPDPVVDKGLVSVRTVGTIGVVLAPLIFWFGTTIHASAGSVDQLAKDVSSLQAEVRDIKERQAKQDKDTAVFLIELKKSLDTLSSVTDIRLGAMERRGGR